MQPDAPEALPSAQAGPAPGSGGPRGPEGALLGGAALNLGFDDPDAWGPEEGDSP